ncbi:class I SAM-dependent methyltransferase [Paraburkholderia mimosarum]|uniref:class I SAM-dependent methyltransferase n=1 Tax=Paraburkholderia mimosarum TaxID=312026 RepID=UPI0003F94F25|nr:class I SAM-dependent methyltransferase [Paraburkholderia mimosarum]
MQLGDLAAFESFGSRALRRVAEVGVRVSYPPFATVHVQGYPPTRLVVPFRGDAAGVLFDPSYKIRSAVRLRMGCCAVPLAKGLGDCQVFALGGGLETIEVPLQALPSSVRLAGAHAAYEPVSPTNFKGWVPDMLVLWKQLSGRTFNHALDVGAGVGNMSVLLAPLCGTLVSSDLSLASLGTAFAHIVSRSDKLPSLLCADAVALPFADESMDLVASRLAAHHFASIPRFVSEAARVLRRGGVFALSDLYTLPEDDIDALNTIERACDPSHVRALSESEWASLIGRQFSIRSVARTRMPLGVPEWMKRFGHSETRITELSRWMSGLPVSPKRALGIKCDRAGLVSSFWNHRLVIIAEKR